MADFSCRGQASSPFDKEPLMNRLFPLACLAVACCFPFIVGERTAVAGETIVVQGNTYAAIAYSPSTGFTYSLGGPVSDRDAKRRALAECRKRTPNARLVLCICSARVEAVVYDDSQDAK
jgi:hypothetical protein